MKKNIYCLIAVLLVGMPVVLPSLSQTFLKGIQAEEKEFEMYEESEINGLKNEEFSGTNLNEEGELESPILEIGEANIEAQIKDEYSVELEPEIAPANVAIITNEVELRAALANPNVLEIRISGGGVGADIFEGALEVNRRVIFRGGTLNFYNDSYIKVTQTGELVVRRERMDSALTLNARSGSTVDSLIVIDGGKLDNQLTSDMDQLTIRNYSDNKMAAVQILNDGEFYNFATLRIGQTTNLDSHGRAEFGIGIKMDSGKFVDRPGGNQITAGYIYASKAFVSSSGSNMMQFEYKTQGAGSTMISSEVDSPIFTNLDSATVSISLDSIFTSLVSIESISENYQFGMVNVQFIATQTGRDSPVISYLNDDRYVHMVTSGQNILGRFRSARVQTTVANIPPVNLPTNIEIIPNSVRMLPNDSVGLAIDFTPNINELDNTSIFWWSDNDQVVTVNQNGVITGKSVGEAEIYAETINGLRAVSSVIVEEFTFAFSGTDGNSTAIVTGYHGTDTEIEIPSTAVNREAGWTTTSTVIGIDDRVFMDKGLTNVLIPGSITEIGEPAFYKNKLSTLIIPDTVKSIGQQAFLENNLTELYIGSGVSRLENQVFGLNNLSSIVIPDTIQQIETLAFHSNNLAEVTIPKTVTHLGLRSFENNSLEKVTFEGEITGLGAQVFAQNPLKEIYVEESSLVHYQRELSPNIIRGVTGRTLLTVDEPRYSDDTQLINNLMVGDELSFSVLSKNRYQLDNLEAFVWEEFIPNVEWFKDAQALPTETKQQFRIAEVEESDSGSYYAIVDGSELPSLSVEVSPLIQPDIPAINPEDGILDLENTNPVIEGLSLRYVSDLYFDATTFSSSNQTVYANDNDGIPKVTVQDMRSASKRNGWELQVRQNQLFMDGAELIFNPFVHEINQDLLNIKSHNGALTVNTEAQRFAGTTTTGNPSGIATMGMGSVDGSGVSLQIPGGVGVGIYEATLIWNLVATPSTANEHIAGK